MEEGKTLSLKNDFVFKELFSKKGCEIFLKDFLSDLLNMEIKKIEVVKEATLEKLVQDNKYGVLDVMATLNDNTCVDIEMQVKKYPSMPERALFYSGKLISAGLGKGEEYKSLKQVIIISILDYEMFPFEEYLGETVTVLKNHREHEIINGQKFYFIELPKFRKAKIDEKKKTNQWLLFIDGKNKEGMEKAMCENEAIKKAKEELEVLLGDNKMQRMAFLREKALRDQISFEKAARDEGMEKGRAEGRNEEKIEIIKNMINEKYSVEQIMKITGVAKEEIKKIKKNL